MLGRACARFRVLVLACHQQEIPGLQLSVFVVGQAVGGPQELGIGAPEVVVGHERFGELQVRLAGSGRIGQCSAVLDDGFAVFSLSEIAIAPRDVPFGQNLGIAGTGEDRQRQDRKYAEAAGARKHDCVRRTRM